MAAIIDQHLPADPQAEYAYGPLLSLLVAARLANPVALVNVADWAQQAVPNSSGTFPPTNSLMIALADSS